VEQLGPYEHTPDQSARAERHLVVAQATGILMSRFTLSADDARKKLFAEAEDEDQPVVDAARKIVAGVGRSASDQTTSGSVGR
jgi:AmiR/NasT family two-component response regulator